MREGLIRRGSIVRVNTGGLYDGIIARVGCIEAHGDELYARCDTPPDGEVVDRRWFLVDELEPVAEEPGGTA